MRSSVCACLSSFLLFGCGAADQPAPRAPDVLKHIQLESEIDSLRQRVADLEMQPPPDAPPVIDLTEETLQDIGSGFTVGKLKLSARLTGLELSGVIINRESVTHEQATFSLRVGRQSKEFVVARIPAGGSSRFTVYVPDAMQSARFGVLSYVRSTVRYY